jgi:hypothetical protein
MKGFGIIVAVLVMATGPSGGVSAAQETPTAPAGASDKSGLHDFDFLTGEWRSHSRRLKERLAGSTEWEEFEGTIISSRSMEGRANTDDTVFYTPEGIYRGLAVRAYDSKTDQWAIWWVDGRNPLGNLDPPMKGRIVNGIGIFYAADTLRGKPIKVRFTWSHITQNSALWEQAYSPDDGKSWETNWIQKIERVK